MSSPFELHPDPWQENVIFSQLLQSPSAKEALHALEQQLKPIFNSHAFYSLDTGMLTVKLQTLTSLLTNANILPYLTPHDFKLGLHLAITPTLSQSASPSKHQPLHFDAFINAIAFCAFYYPPQKDHLHAPSPRLLDAPVRLDVALTTVCHRMVASANSPRSVIATAASPATSLAFITPQTTLSDSFSSQSLTNAMCDSPEPEKWFTPAQSTVRTNLFPTEESSCPPTRHEDSDVEATSHDVVSSAPTQKDITSESDAEPKPSPGNAGDADEIDAAPQVSETEQNISSLTPIRNRAEKAIFPPRTEENILENVEISSPPIAQLNFAEEGIPQQVIDKDYKLEVSEHTDYQNVCKVTPVIPFVAVNKSFSDQFILPAAVAEVRNKSAETPQKTLVEVENTPPDSAQTNLALAPSPAVSHLPSPDGCFESPELTGDPCTLKNYSSIEPMSSRKLSFSDSDDATDSSSCYENVSDNEDTMIRIESAFENSHAVADSEENDARSDVLSLDSQFPSPNAEGAIMVQISPQSEPNPLYGLAGTSSGSLSEGETNSEMETASQTQEHDFLDSQSISNERDAPRLEAVLAPDAPSVNRNQQTCVFEATHDIALRSEPRISLGLPADAFEEAGIAVLRTPLAPVRSARIPDPDMEDVVEDEEEHTLLFENGYESDGSELSMRTRETMSKMVEDYLSLHGSSSPQCGPDGNYYAEDQVLMTPDRQSYVEFQDEIASEKNTIVEYGPCMSEKAESKQSRISPVLQHSFQEFGRANDEDEFGFTDEINPVKREDVKCALSPVFYAQKASFSSEITPDGLNFIKKQLVLPSPFVFTDSTVGSSMNSGPSIHETENVTQSEEPETAEQQALTTVPVIQENRMEGTVVRHPQHANAEAIEMEMMRVMRETLETCRVLREEIANKQQIRQERFQQQEPYQGGFLRWIELLAFGLIIMFAILVLVERRIQRGLFVDVLV